MYSLCVGVLRWTCFVAFSSLTIILLMKSDADCFALMVMCISVLCFFLVVLWVGRQSVVFELPGHTHLLINLFY